MVEPESDGQKAPVTVRLATGKDLPELLGLYRQLAGSRLGALPADIDEATALFYRVLAQPDRQLLVTEVGGHVVGTADLLIVPNLTHGGAPWAIVENVMVDGASRRGGVGSALITEIARRCKEAGCYKIQLLSNKERTQAHRFYRSVGFEALAEGFRRFLL